MALEIVWFALGFFIAAGILVIAAYRNLQWSNLMIPIFLALIGLIVAIIGVLQGGTVDETIQRLYLEIGLQFASTVMIAMLMTPMGRKYFEPYILGIAGITMLFATMFFI